MADALRLGAPWPGAVAVSGGSDSLALMALLARWAKDHKLSRPIVLTVDHGLRNGSAEDARQVVNSAAAAGLKAHVLHWRGSKPESDIEAAARDARYRLMGGWCLKQRVSGLYLAHSLEDQAETFLLRLARGSGLDGLSAMKSVAPLPSRKCEGVVLVRPMLGFERTRLRAFLAAEGQTWLEDPMNADFRFARVRIRSAWPTLEGIGLSPARIAAAAAHLARAREALDRDTRELISGACHFEDGNALVDAARLVDAPTEVGLRALAHVLMVVSASDYRPRFERLERLFTRICAGEFRSGCTLHGCRIAPAKKRGALFGPGTLVVAPENTRSRRSGAGRAEKVPGNPQEINSPA
jgi:tRNA(Ile)-lysidine synthase